MLPPSDTPNGAAIGQTGAALVEQDQPRERRQPLEEPRKRGLLPCELDVRNPAVHEHQVERPVADDLIRNIDVAASRVVRPAWHCLHSLPRCARRRVTRQAAARRPLNAITYCFCSPSPWMPSSTMSPTFR